MTPSIVPKLGLLEELGCYSTNDFIFLDKEQLERVCIIDEDSENIKFRTAEVNHLLALIQWIVSFNFTYGWTRNSMEDFQEWRFERFMRPSPEPAPIPVPPAPVVTVVSHDRPTLSTEEKALIDFKKSIKLDIDNYNELTNDDQFYKWYKDTISTAKMHGLHNVLDESFTPTTEQFDLFESQNLFFYNVLEQKLGTTKSKVHLYTYEECSDGQKVFAALRKAYKDGMTGNLLVTVYKKN